MMDPKMLSEVVICKEHDSVIEVSRILRDTRQRHLVVTNDSQEPVGIISTVDINNRVVSEEKNASELVALDIMTKGIATIEVSEGYDKAYSLMIEKGLHSVPVTKDKKLVGLLDFNRLFMNAEACIPDEKH